MMAGLSFDVKKKIMKQFAFKPLKTSDRWEYAVSTSWLTMWQDMDKQSQLHKDACHSLESWTSGTSLENKQSCSHVPPLTMSESDKENTYIPETLWTIYGAWFGLDDAHQLRRRPIYNLYQRIGSEASLESSYLCDNELDFLPIWVARLDDLVQGQRQDLLQVFAWDTFEHIAKQVRRVLRLKKNVKVRLWFSIQEENEHVVLEPVIDFHQSLLNKIVAEIPSVKSVLEKRQNELSRRFGSDGVLTDGKVSYRGPLDMEWYGDRILSISLGVEEIGVDLSNTATSEDVFVPIDEENVDSIVTISSIRNEWEDVLATYMDEYSENMNARTKAIKENLLGSAKKIVGEKLDEISEIRHDYEKRFREVEKREADVDTRERDLVDKERDLASRLARYKSGLEDFHKQKQKRMEEMKMIEEQNKISESKVTLNIGGILYTTSITTLTKGDNSLLSTMFSGRHPVVRERDGTYFIDRDGINFRYILNYLRDCHGAVEALPLERKLLKELVIEAKYYGLPEMELLLKQKMDG